MPALVHTAEPWRVHDEDVVSQAEGGLAVCVTAGLLENRAADARRIVACVNACAGIPTGALEVAGVGGLEKWWSEPTKRDALLDACQAAAVALPVLRNTLAIAGCPAGAAKADEILALVNEAIAKAVAA